MIRDLKVNGLSDPKGIDRITPVFSWQYDDETQFTIQLSSVEDFHHIILLRDMRNPYFIYDGFPLERGRTYYWRVRSRLGKWAQGRFSTLDG